LQRKFHISYVSCTERYKTLDAAFAVFYVRGFWERRSKAMGRPREFCIDGALSKALHVFWQRGFEGTSLSDLTEAMGITRPSLYAAYGNKEELFRKALDLYDEQYLAFTREALDEPSAYAVVERLLKGFADIATDKGHPPGCLGTNGALTCSAAAEPIRQELIKRRASFEQALRKRLEKAKTSGDLPATANPGDLACFIMTVTQGMTVQASSGVTRKALQRVAELALRAWPV
jgi:AcrR family transcriptional regulator